MKQNVTEQQGKPSCHVNYSRLTSSKRTVTMQTYIVWSLQFYA